VGSRSLRARDSVFHDTAIHFGGSEENSFSGRYLPRGESTDRASDTPVARLLSRPLRVGTKLRLDQPNAPSVKRARRCRSGVPSIEWYMIPRCRPDSLTISGRLDQALTELATLPSQLQLPPIFARDRTSTPPFGKQRGLYRTLGPVRECRYSVRRDRTIAFLGRGRHSTSATHLRRAGTPSERSILIRLNRPRPIYRFTIDGTHRT